MNTERSVANMNPSDVENYIDIEKVHQHTFLHLQNKVNVLLQHNRNKANAIGQINISSRWISK